MFLVLFPNTQFVGYHISSHRAFLSCRIGDNSAYWANIGVLVFGEGGVDDAEDADVIIHELGYAVASCHYVASGFVLLFVLTCPRRQLPTL